LYTLGLSTYTHDSAACLVNCGKILVAAEEERFSRKKHTGDLPKEAINFCVHKAGISFLQISEIAVSEQPYLKFSRVILDHVKSYPRSFRHFMRTMPDWMGHRLLVPQLLEEELGLTQKIFFIPHHLSHAASAFYPSSFETAALLTLDGVGEWSTASRGRGLGDRIYLNKEMAYPNSIGLLYTCVTTFLGFSAHGDEGKTMALAALGEPRFLNALKSIVDMRPDGSIRLDPKVFSFSTGDRMWGWRFEKLFGSSRGRGQPFEQAHYDLAASLQSLLEELVVLICRDLHKETGEKALCLAGGVALNCLANQKILEQTPFERLFVQPAAGDSGGALGAALYVQNGLRRQPRTPMEHAYLGPEFSDEEILGTLEKSDLPFEKHTKSELLQKTCAALAEGAIVGWYQGSLEFGPRALGHRSILANPCRADAKQVLNSRIKDREPFQPFAPIVQKERAADYFHLIQDSPFMLLAPKVREEHRSYLPAITHFDGTARVQTVDQNTNPLIYELLSKFEKVSGFPILVNTSFNGKGEPIVCTPREALRCFEKNGIDLLVMGSFIVRGRQHLGDRWANC